MARRRVEPPSTDVEIEREGRRYRGSYVVDKGMITVNFDEGGTKTTHVGGMPPRTLAEWLLSELVNEYRQRGRGAAG